MTRRGKKYIEAAKKIDPQHLYGPVEALEMVRDLAYSPFDETVELAVRLGIDPRKADKVLRGTVSLPAGTGKSVRVAASPPARRLKRPAPPGPTCRFG